MKKCTIYAAGIANQHFFILSQLKKSSLHYKTSLVYKTIQLWTVVINPSGFLFLYYLFLMIYIIVMIINSSIQDNTWS